MIEIDGAHGEGGGQIIRTAVAMSVITQKPVKIVNIRANRPNPGLQAQHIASIKAVADLCSASIKGLQLGSTEVIFVPGSDFKDNLEVSIDTAGSIGLVLQAVLPAAFHSGKKVSIRFKGGATFGKWAPPLSYMNNVLFPVLAKHGYAAFAGAHKEGFYPKGGAEAAVDIHPPTEKQPFHLDKQVNFTKHLVNLKIVSSGSLEAEEAAERLAEQFDISLRDKGFQITAELLYKDTDSSGYGALTFIEEEGIIIGADIVSDKKLTPELAGHKLAEQLLKELESKAPVDSHLADQLIPYLAMNGGKILASEITEHTKTNVWVVERFVGKKFTIKGNMVSVEQD